MLPTFLSVRSRNEAYEVIALIRAIRKHSVPDYKDVVRSISDINQLYNYKDAYGRNLLHISVLFKFPFKDEVLLKKISGEELDNFGHTPAYYAVMLNELEWFKVLTHDGKSDFLNQDRDFFLKSALSYSSFEVVDFMSTIFNMTRVEVLHKAIDLNNIKALASFADKINICKLGHDQLSELIIYAEHNQKKQSYYFLSDHHLCKNFLGDVDSFNDD